jgi:peroxiredoxin family protein
MNNKKSFLIITVTVFILFWGLGALRFNYQFADILFKVLLIPFGFLYSIYESYSLSNFNSSHIVNDEIFQLTVFITAALEQAVLFFWIFKSLKKISYTNKNTFF